ncbi:MAG TPA: hypothetical protein DCM87_16435 [Planctomycetes bacterium]|nr:hypothetical protein [Planctomycetota bacterium]
MFSLQRKIALKRARIALRAGNLEGACRILHAPELQEQREGQELCRKLVDALIARARAHAACASLPEAMLDLKRAIDFGGARPDAVQLRNELGAKLAPVRPGLTAARFASLSTCAAPPAPPAPLTPSPSPPAPPAAPRPPSSRLYLWVDGVGTYLVAPSPRIVIGRHDSSAAPDIPLPGRIPGLAAEILRTSEQYMLCPHCEAAVNGRRVSEKVLAPGDRIRLGESPAFTFYVPCPMSTTALLRLEPPSLLQGKASDVLLLDQFMVIGRKGLAHVKTAFGPMELVLMLEDGHLTARSKEMITADGSPGPAHECAIELGRRVCVEGLSFTVTEG